MKRTPCQRLSQRQKNKDFAEISCSFVAISSQFGQDALLCLQQVDYIPSQLNGQGKKRVTQENKTTLIRVYLLTVWQETNQAQRPLWRFRLEDPHTRWQQGFTTIEELLEILQPELPKPETEGDMEP
jgi:hypothetical protein